MSQQDRAVVERLGVQVKGMLAQGVHTQAALHPSSTQEGVMLRAYIHKQDCTLVALRRVKYSP